MAFIEASDLKHSFERRDEEGKVCEIIQALTGVNMTVEQGEFIAVLGHNGSGKSTFAKHVNVLLKPDEGTLFVDGMNVTDGDHIWDIRQAAGMIFQNPDNQLVAGVVEEDVAFGPENIGIPTEEIRQRVTEALTSVDMLDYRYHSPNQLSGGQKQRIAIAGVLAMQPKCILFDESTAMLDPGGRLEVLEAARKLNREKGVTILWITHNMEEVVDADRIYVMDGGRVTMEGRPAEIFERAAELEALGLDVPVITRLSLELRRKGREIPRPALSRRELVEDLIQLNGDRPQPEQAADHIKEAQAPALLDEQGVSVAEAEDMARPEILMRLDHVDYTYSPGSPYQAKALQQVDLTLRKGEFLAVIGHTGSGKSTLLQVMGGLLPPTAGTIYYKDKDIYSKDFSKKELRRSVGLVFQYPEYQLFEMTVLKDVAYGPLNMGFSQEEAAQKAREGLRLAGLAQKYWEMSPFELSGGEKRRAAIAGVLAMHPQVLILDEPTAGLDPKGRRELFNLIRRLNREEGMTIVLVSHSMDDVAALADRVAVFDHGRLCMEDTPDKVFSRRQELEEMHLALPQVTYLMAELKESGLDADCSVIRPDQALEELERLIEIPMSRQKKKE